MPRSRSVRLLASRARQREGLEANQVDRRVLLNPTSARQSHHRVNQRSNINHRDADQSAVDDTLEEGRSKRRQTEELVTRHVRRSDGVAQKTFEIRQSDVIQNRSRTPGSRGTAGAEVGRTQLKKRMPCCNANQRVRAAGSGQETPGVCPPSGTRNVNEAMIAM